jgi:nucleotide-binding universal stress UspA family protein
MRVDTMPAAGEQKRKGFRKAASDRPTVRGRRAVERIAVGVDGYPEGRDAAALAAAIARATGAELMLVAVHPEPVVVLPAGLDWKSVRQQARSMLAEVRDELAPDARLAVETDLSVARALHRVITREHRDLLVVGSSRHGPEGHVRIGKRVRQLLCHFECPLAIAPRGYQAKRDAKFARIGVGYDGSPESVAALELAAAIALEAWAEIHVCGIVDDRMPSVGFGILWVGGTAGAWKEIVQEQVDLLRDRALDAVKNVGSRVEVVAEPGRPADGLLALSRGVDLLVIGSRRWGPAARVLLGSTGEAVLHDAACPVLTVPRPAP